MFENLKKAVISNGWKFPEGEVKRWYAGSANGNGSVSSGIVQTVNFWKNAERAKKCRAHGKRWKTCIIRISKNFLGSLIKS